MATFSLRPEYRPVWTAFAYVTWKDVWGNVLIINSFRKVSVDKRDGENLELTV